jgi:hypothetical protein
MDNLRFEARDLKPYGEYASEATLVEGKTYFAVHFLDDEMLVPELWPLVFIGRDREPSDSGKLYFQDAESYFAGARYESVTGAEDVEFHTVDSGTPAVFEFEKALEVLLRCSLRRRASGM